MPKKDSRYFKLIDEQGAPAPIGQYQGFEIEGLLFVSVPGASEGQLKKVIKDLGDQYYRKALAGEPLPALIVTNQPLQTYRWVPVEEDKKK